MKSPENDELFHVEHYEYSLFKLCKFAFLCLMLMIPACKSEDPEPEKKDPIYNDLLKEETNAKTAASIETKKIDELTKEYQKSEVRTIERKSVARDISTSQEALRKYEQQIEYFRIALIKRKYEAQTSYKRAQAEDKPWPDSKEISAYLQEKKMLAVSRNWNIRVPKPSNPVNSVKLKAEPEKPNNEY